MCRLLMTLSREWIAAASASTLWRERETQRVKENLLVLGYCTLARFCESGRCLSRWHELKALPKKMTFCCCVAVSPESPAHDGYKGEKRESWVELLTCSTKIRLLWFSNDGLAHWSLEIEKSPSFVPSAHATFSEKVCLNMLTYAWK